MGWRCMSLHILQNKILQLCEPAYKDKDFLVWHNPYAVINGLSKIKTRSWNHFITFNELIISQEEEWSVEGQWWVETYLHLYQFMESQQIYFWYLMCPRYCILGYIVWGNSVKQECIRSCMVFMGTMLAIPKSTSCKMENLGIFKLRSENFLINLRFWVQCWRI